MGIRLLTEADGSAYREVRLRGLREEPDAFSTSYVDEAARPLDITIDRLRSQQRDLNRFTLGAFDGSGALLGIITFSRYSREKERHKATISGFYVVSEARRGGLGRRLLNETLARARQIPGLIQVDLVVVTRQFAARNLYTSFGFIPFGLERRALKLDGDFLDEEYLVLFLDPPPER